MIQTAETAMAGFETQITGLETDIQAQQDIIDAGNPGETAHDNAVTQKATLEGQLTTAQEGKASEE